MSDPCEGSTVSSPEYFRPYLRSIAVRHIGRHEAAKIDPSDVVQQTLLDAIRTPGNFRDRSEGEAKSWLRRLLICNLADLRRNFGRARRDQAREESLDQSAAADPAECSGLRSSLVRTPSSILNLRESSARLRAAIEMLPEASRKAVTLRHIEGLSISEIASEMDRTPAAIAGLLKRGLAELRVLMAE